MVIDLPVNNGVDPAIVAVEGLVARIREIFYRQATVTQSYNR